MCALCREITRMFIIKQRALASAYCHDDKKWLHTHSPRKHILDMCLLRYHNNLMYLQISVNINLFIYYHSCFVYQILIEMHIEAIFSCKREIKTCVTCYCYSP